MENAEKKIRIREIGKKTDPGNDMWAFIDAVMEQWNALYPDVPIDEDDVIDAMQESSETLPS